MGPGAAGRQVAAHGLEAPVVILLVALLALVALVPLLGGRLSRLATLDLHQARLLLAATVIQAVITQIAMDVPTWTARTAHVVSYLLVAAFLWANRRLPWLWLVAVGGGLNLVTILANGGVMPASPGALARSGRSAPGTAFENSALVDHARLSWLGDVFAVPSSWPLANVFSVGDVILLLGGGLLVHRVAGSRLPWRARRDAARAPAAVPGRDTAQTPAAGPGRDTAQAPAAGPGRDARFTLLRDNADFRRLWLAGASSDIGDWTYSLAVIAILAVQGASPTVFAALIVVQMLASSAVGLLGTPVVDRVDRMQLLVGTNVAQALAVSSLLIPDEPTVAHLLVVAALLGGFGAIVKPATMASIPNLVTGDELVRANGYVAAAFNVAVSLGPVVGAGVVSTWGARPAFLLNAVSFLLSASLIARIRRRSVSEDLGHPETWAAVATAGLRHIVRRPALRALVVMIALVGFGAAVRGPVEPLFIVGDLGGNPGAIGALASLWGLGMVVGSTMAVVAGRRWPLERVLVLSVGVLAVCVVSASRSSVLAPVAALWLLAGSANAIGSVAYESLLQQRTPDHLRGRVFGAAEAVLGSTYLVGALVSGAVGTLVGTRAGMALAGAAVAVAAGYGVLVVLRRPAGEPGGTGESTGGDTSGSTLLVR